MGVKMVSQCVNRLAIRLSRVAVRKSQAALAESIGRSQTWFSRVENGERGSVVTARDLVKLAETLGVNVSDLEGR